MLYQTKGIVLRSVKYGESSLITTMFTHQFGVQGYLVQGVRKSGSKAGKAGLLQPSVLLDLAAFQSPQISLQRLREFHPAHIYRSIQEDIVKNSVALFSVELLLRLLPEQAPLPELFNFCFSYFLQLDLLGPLAVANFPIFFITKIGNYLGYSLSGNYSTETPHLNLIEGSFTTHLPPIPIEVRDTDARALQSILEVEKMELLAQIHIGSDVRFRLLDWYILFLQQHTQHFSPIKSLPVLRAILH
ncbi:MAG: DNA repair protein RecO [Bacteroidetes bacterium]|nr:DNA repair protein RecO [Bacteroidota bacterium]